MKGSRRNTIPCPVPLGQRGVLLYVLWSSGFETLTYFLKEWRAAILALLPINCHWDSAGMALVVAESPSAHPALKTCHIYIYNPGSYTNPDENLLGAHGRFPHPLAAPSWIQSQLGKPWDHSSQMCCQGPGWAETTPSSLRTEQQLQRKYNCIIIILTHLKAGRASVPPMASGFSLALSLYLKIHTHPFVRVLEFLINLITQVMQRKLLHPRSVASET